GAGRMTESSLKPDYWDLAVSQLMRRDRILRKIIPMHPEVHLTTRGQPFVTLARSVVGQQISVKAADAIWARVDGICADGFTPAALTEAGFDALRAAGLSQPKAEYLLDLAVHFHEERVHPALWVDMEDEAIIAEL